MLTLRWKQIIDYQEGFVGIILNFYCKEVRIILFFPKSLQKGYGI